MPKASQIDLLIDLGEAATKANPGDGQANGPLVVSGSSKKMKSLSTPESWKAFANGSGDSSYFEALHNARQASSMEGPRVVTADESFVAVKTSNSCRGSPVDVYSEDSSLLMNSADLAAVKHIPPSGHLLD